MEIHRGTVRMAILIGPLCFKIPRVDLWLQLCWDALIGVFHPSAWRHLRIDLRERWREFKRAIEHNLSEWSCWRVNRASHMARVYFSTGLFSVMARADGIKPHIKEWLAVLATLPAAAQGYLACIDPHTIDTPNIRKTKTGYRFIDYGCHKGYHDPRNANYNICGFLTIWRPELEAALKLPKE